MNKPILYLCYALLIHYQRRYYLINMSIIAYKSEKNSPLYVEIGNSLLREQYSKSIDADKAKLNGNNLIIQFFGLLLDQLVGMAHVASAMYKAYVIDDVKGEIPIELKQNVKTEIKPVIINLIKMYYVSQGLYYSNEFKCNKCTVLCSGLPICIYKLYNYNIAIVSAVNRNKQPLFTLTAVCHFSSFISKDCRINKISATLPDYIRREFYNQSYNYHLSTTTSKGDRETLRIITESHYIPALKKLIEIIEFNIPTFKAEAAADIAKLVRLDNVYSSDYKAYSFNISPLENEKCIENGKNNINFSTFHIKDITTTGTFPTTTYSRNSPKFNPICTALFTKYDPNDIYPKNKSKDLAGLLPKNYESNLLTYEEYADVYEIVVAEECFKAIKEMFYGTHNESEINKKHKMLLEMILYNNGSWCCSNKKGENNPFYVKASSLKSNISSYKYPFNLQYFIDTTLRIFTNEFDIKKNASSAKDYNKLEEHFIVLLFLIYYVYKSIITMYGCLHSYTDIRLFYDGENSDLQEIDADSVIHSLIESVLVTASSYNFKDASTLFNSTNVDKEYKQLAQ